MALKWAAQLFAGPVGAAFAFLKGIYDAVTWFLENKKRLEALVTRVFTAFQELIKGANVGAIAESVEQTLSGLIVPALDAVAKFLGFGKVPDKIREFISNVRDWIQDKIRSLLKLILKPFEKLFKSRNRGAKNTESLTEDVVVPMEKKDGGKKNQTLSVETDGTSISIMLEGEREVDIGKLVCDGASKLQAENASGAGKGALETSANDAKSLVKRIRENGMRVVTILKGCARANHLT